MEIIHALPKFAVNKMIKEKATWSSFSGSLAKIIKDKNKASISSTRGVRYFGPSKMSFVNLLKHSLSIIAVFKKTLLIRSILFLIAYLFLITGNIFNNYINTSHWSYYYDVLSNNII